MKNFLPYHPLRSLMGGIAILSLQAGISQACDATGAGTVESTAYIGTICTTAASHCPPGTAPANGAKVYSNANPALFSVLAGTFGQGNDSGGFYVLMPNFGGRMPVGSSLSYIGAQPSPYSSVNLGQQRGAESAQVNIKNFPAHDHDASVVASLPQGTTISFNVTTSIHATGAAGDSPTPDSSYPYMAGLDTSMDSNMKMWDSTLNNPVNVGGLSASYNATSAAYWIKRGFSLTVNSTGQEVTTNIPTIPPQMALTYCVVTMGTYPHRP